MTRPTDSQLVLAALRAHGGWLTEETLIAEAGISTETVTDTVAALDREGALDVHDLGRLTLLTDADQDVEEAIAELFDRAEQTGWHAFDINRDGRRSE